MSRIAVVGGGLAGLCVANMLHGHDVVVFEKDATPGGLMRCRRRDGHLFYTCGGHVFNSRNPAALEWFWSVFDRADFSKHERKAVIVLADGTVVPYPIENHLYLLKHEWQTKVYSDLDGLGKDVRQPRDFGEFLRATFGETLCELYFRPYNRKVWQADLSRIPLSWLDGKLPMPTPEEIRQANRERREERQMVHSTFWSPLQGGPQFIIDALARRVELRRSREVTSIDIRPDGRKEVCGEVFDAVFFCGNVKDIPSLVRQDFMDRHRRALDGLLFHGTTTALCEIDANPWSWVYLPSPAYKCHRIICTGNFAATNNAPAAGRKRICATVEFTDFVPDSEIAGHVGRLPFSPRFLESNYTRCSYPIQSAGTRDAIATLKADLKERGIWLVGRFAEWEYQNMDAVVASALRAVADFNGRGSERPNPYFRRGVIRAVNHDED